MPNVRGRILPEVELAGRAKKFLDVLLWMSKPRPHDIRALDELEVLRIYLHSVCPFQAQIRLWVPQHHADAINALKKAEIDFSLVTPRQAKDKIREELKDSDVELLNAVSTAQGIDADCLTTNRMDWFPFIEEVQKFSILLTDCDFLLPYAETFARGHDIPWAFGYKVWKQPWSAFYQLCELRTFKPGLDLLHKAFQKGVSTDAQETGRSLVYNRIANVCFTRDRLLFYEIQRLAARRAGWKRQQFSLEIPYYLNFYYLLIWGAFDHAALFTSQ